MSGIGASRKALPDVSRLTFRPTDSKSSFSAARAEASWSITKTVELAAGVLLHGSIVVPGRYLAVIFPGPKIGAHPHYPNCDWLRKTCLERLEG